MNETPRSERLHIGLFGRRNVGKSSLINLLTGQAVALVSPVAGTTTDPVYKAMELLPFGPVIFIDTAGIDDEGDLGKQRVASTERAMRKADIALLVVSSEEEPGAFEEKIIWENMEKNIPVIGVINKVDLNDDFKTVRDWFAQKGVLGIPVSAVTGKGRYDLIKEIIAKCGEEEKGPSIVEGIINPGDTAVLVVPVDTGAPKGRIILPQVQTIRDILDHNGRSTVVTVEQLGDTLENMKAPPKVVVTDSQAFSEVSRITPEEIPLTSFSILFARYKGRLAQLAAGAMTVKELRPGDKVLIAEACTHHSQKDDIGRIKIPSWLNNSVGGKLKYQYSTGWDFPANLSDIKLVIHCGACMLNRKEVLYRLNLLKQMGIPVVNYGVLIAYIHGILDRVLMPFPEMRAFGYHKEETCNDLSG